MKHAHTVKLQIQSYKQGDLDALCNFYSCATLLAALFPRYRAAFDQMAGGGGLSNRLVDPIVRTASRGRGSPHDVIARWFYRGQYVRPACHLLNQMMRLDRHRTRFAYRRGNRSVRTFDAIAASIDRGLPVLLAWNSGDFGSHSVVVRGYRRAQLRWLLLIDPGDIPGCDARIAWEQLSATMHTPPELIMVDGETHDGERPDKLVEDRGGWRVERWWCRDGRVGYYDLDELRTLVDAKTRPAR